MHLLTYGQYGLMDQYTPLDLSSSNRLPTSAAMPCHYRGSSEKGRMLPSAVAGRTGRQPECRLSAEPQTPADESDTLLWQHRYQVRQHRDNDNLPPNNENF